MILKRGSGSSVQLHGAAGWESRRSHLLSAIALAALAGCDGTSASIGGAGDVTASPTQYEPGAAPTVAKLRVQAPETEHFFIRGTVPVPPGTVVDGSIQTPFSVISRPAEAYAITQVETVSRYPDAADGADVVEIIAHVRRPHVEPGTPLEYEVVYRPHSPETFEYSEEVDALMGAPGALKLVAKDPFGHDYALDLLQKERMSDPGVETIRRGSLIWETKTPGVMLPVQPVTGSEGTLPRLMGVESYVRRYARQDFFAIDLLVHNAFDATDGATSHDDSIPDLYFRSLELELPQGWHVVHVHDDLFSGDATNVGNIQRAPLVRPLADGKMHLMHRQAQFSRRIFVAKGDALELAQAEAERQSLAFCTAGVTDGGAPLWSWWNEETARYMPQNHLLPDLSIMTSREQLEAQYRGKFDERMAQVRNGNGAGHPVQSGNLGWSHPYGVGYGGMTGGERIDQIPGVDLAWSGSQSAYRYHELRSKMVQERQPYHLYSSSGAPTRYEDHVRTEGNPNGPWLPFGMMMTLPGNQNYFFQNPVTFQANYVRANNLEPSYENALRGYQPIDLQHLIRYTSDLLTLTWLGNDSLAKSQLEATAELFRMTHHDGYASSGTYAAVASMRAKKLRVQEFPGTGVDYRRGEAWGLFAATGAYACGSPELRERFRPWMAEVARTVRAGQSECTGNIMSTHIGSYGDGSYRTRQAFEVAFVVNALESMRTTVFTDVDDEIHETLVSSIVDCAYSTIQAPFWDDAFGGLRNVTAVGTRDGSVPDFCFNLPHDAGFGSTTIENQASMTIWSIAYQLTGDGEFLTKAAQAVGSTTNLQSEIQQLGPTKLAHSAFLLRTVQGLTVNH